MNKKFVVYQQNRCFPAFNFNVEHVYLLLQILLEKLKEANCQFSRITYPDSVMYSWILYPSTTTWNGNHVSSKAQGSPLSSNYACKRRRLYCWAFNTVAEVSCRNKGRQWPESRSFFIVCLSMKQWIKLKCTYGSISNVFENWTKWDLVRTTK